MKTSYPELLKKLRAQTKLSRDRDVRIKVELILLAHRLGSISEACSRRGFSRKFYYKWFGRLERAKFNIRALEECSRRPKRSPGKTKYSLEKRVHYFHGLGYGARMIEAILRREGKRLHRSTICHILNNRSHRKKRRRALLKTHRRRYELPIPGQRMQIDVKYIPELIDGHRAYAFVAVDECTRWRFARAYWSLSPSSTVDFLERLKLAVPFPLHTLQTDNGFEFTHKLNPTIKNAVHPMEAWCAQAGLVHRLIPPGEKELNGKVERSHRIDAQYFYWQAPTDTLENFNEAYAAWIKVYNCERPHGGIDYQTPWEKLMERWETLRKSCETPELQLHCSRFVKELPMKIQIQRQHPKKREAA